MSRQNPIPTNKNNPCVICGNDDGDCRVHHVTGDPWCMKSTHVFTGSVVRTANSSFKAKKLTSDNQWMIFNPTNEQGETFKREYKPVERKSAANLMPLEVRDKHYRKLVSYRGLSQRHRQKLLDRGFLNDEIDLAVSQNWLCSWESGISSAIYPNDLCGVNLEKGIFHGGSGIAFAYQDKGLIVGLNIANDSRDGAKYYPLSSSNSGGVSYHLPSGDQPIFHWVHPEATEVQKTWICEGTIKSLLTAFKLWRNNKNIQVIGIGGNNFLNHYKSIKPLLTETNVFCPDAGMITNSKVWDNYANFIKKVNQDKINISVAWWNQIDKSAGDIDELTDYSQIKYISSKEFFTIAKLGIKNAEVKKVQEQKIQQKASEFEQLKAIRHGLTNITEVPYKVVNVDHLEQVLGDLIQPGTLNIIISDTGTGKSESIIPFATKAEAFFSWHNRISLGRGTSNKLGLDYKESNSNTNLSKKKKAAFCAPSAYQFNPNHLRNNQGILLVDEADQVFDFLFGSLCNKDGIRPLLLSTLESHIDSAIYGQGLCLFMSADITQKEIDLIKQLAPENTPVRLIINKYQPQRPDINFDVSDSPEGQLSELVSKLKDGVPCFVLDDMKNGVKGCKSLAEYVRQNFPELKDLILEIHADSQHDPKVKAFNDNPDEESKKYLMIICSPSIISGVSLKNQRFINGVFGFCNGILMDREIKQFLNRVRGAKDIYLWVAESGFEPMGLPSQLVTPEEISNYYQRNYEVNSRHLLSYKPEYEVMTGEWSSPYFKLFCKNQSYKTITAKYLRQFTREHLEEIGYGINEINHTPDGGIDDIKNALSKVWNNIEIQEAEAIDASELLSDSLMEAIQATGEIPSDMLAAYKKTLLFRQFGEELIQATTFVHKKTEREFTGYAAMALKNARGEYQRHLENFYLLSQPIDEARERDYKAEAKQLKHGERFAGDVRWNSRKRKCREVLGLHEFINPEKLDNWFSPQDFADLANKAKTYAGQVHEVLNLNVSELSSGQIFGELMNQLGLGLDKKSVPGQKWKLRRINKQDWEYVQLYLKHKESLKLERENAVTSAAAFTEQATVAKVDPLVPSIVEKFENIRSREDWDYITATITEEQKLAAWALLGVEEQQRIRDLYHNPVVKQLALEDVKPVEVKPVFYDDSAREKYQQSQSPITNDQLPMTNDLDNAIPSVSVAIAQLKVASNWGEVERIRHDLFTQAWAYLTPEDDARLRQLHQQWTQPQPQRVRWFFDRIGEYLLLEVNGAIAKIQSLMTGDISEKNCSELKFICS
ncbi:plasmid replication protein, CyRepA1 family [Anabaena lutea]|uniref:Replication origin-binding protein domain-containing protein n=1 Tax=Anabaena lutea FACHB-196 TaxID=2692881 RepID=A0ABR8FMN5_9NOST|nr:plasmid replication protein, CyRepA1 family [Anabaena lutea]MBD2571369.1 hypothetical protein [Anabaena lutea FACHB-196]